MGDIPKRLTIFHKTKSLILKTCIAITPLLAFLALMRLIVEE